MNNEEKILQMLEEVMATQKKQGELLQEIDLRSARTQVLLETDFKRDWGKAQGDEDVS